MTSTQPESQAYRFSSELMRLLNEEVVSEAMWWMDTRTFAVNPKFFQEHVLDKYFRGTKYASFLRTMHKMGFARLSRSYDMPKGIVAYANPLFIKGKPELLKKIEMHNSGRKAMRGADGRDVAAVTARKVNAAPSPGGSPVSSMRQNSASTATATGPSISSYVLGAIKQDHMKTQLLRPNFGQPKPLMVGGASLAAPQREFRREPVTLPLPGAFLNQQQRTMSVYQRHLEQSAILRARQQAEMDALQDELITRRRMMLSGLLPSSLNPRGNMGMGFR